MSKYTVELRFVCEQASGLKDSVGYNGVENVITNAAPKIFDFYYPIFDESYRRALEEKILLHYYTRELCEETIGLWKLRLKSKMNEIMPYYNQLYESALLKFDPFVDIDYTQTHRGRANETKKQEKNRETSADTSFDENTENLATTDNIEHIVGENVENEVEVTNTVGNEKVHTTDNTITNETTNTVTHTDDVKDTVQDTVTDRELTKTVTISDVENTVTHDTEILDGNQDKTGHNVTVMRKSNADTATTTFNAVTDTRTPNLTENKKTDDITDDTGTGSDLRNIQRSEDTITEQTEGSEEHATGRKNYSDQSLDAYSDTPQGGVLSGFVAGYDNSLNSVGIDPETGMQRLNVRINNKYLTNDRDISAVHNETTAQDINKEAEMKNTKNFDETTDDDVYHNRDYRTTLDGTTVTTNTGTETNVRTGSQSVRTDWGEVDTTTEDIDENLKTDNTTTKDTTKDFTKNETDLTTENEHTAENLTKNEVEAIDTTTDFTREQIENETIDTNKDTVEDFTGTTDDKENYTRDKSTNNTYHSDKVVGSKKNFLESIADDLQHNIRNTDEYINHAVGKISDITKSKMLLEFRETFINIDEMIIEELNELFFMLY